MQTLIPIQQIYNTIDLVGDTITLRVVTRTFSNYGDATETYVDTTGIKTIVTSANNSSYGILIATDQEVKPGIFQDSDKRFFFKANQTGLTLDNQIQHNSLWYQIKSILQLSLGDTVYAIEVIGSKI